MKRVLILALVLLALALFAVWRSRGPEVSALVPDSQASDESEREPTLSSLNAHEERQDLASAPDALPVSEPVPVSFGFVGPPAPHVAARKSVTVFVKLHFADSHEPLSSVLGNVSWSMDEVRGRGAQLESMGGGSFAANVPVGVRLSALQLFPSEENLAGPSTSANVAGRFHPFLASLDLLVEQSDLELAYELERGHELRGIVRDAQSLRPIAGADVELVSQRGTSVRWISATDGRFVFGDAGPKLSLRVAHGEFSTFFRSYSEAELGPGAPDLEVLLERGLRVSGRVVDKDGAAREGVELRFVARDSARTGFIQRTGEDGSFTFTQVPPCWSASITGMYDDKPERIYLGARVELGALKRDVTDLVLVDPGSTCIKIFVQDADGTPVGPWGYGFECDAPYLLEPDFHTSDYQVNIHGSIDWKQVRVSSEEIGRTVLVPIGVPLHLRAVAILDPEKPNRIAIGSKDLVLERSYDPPLEVRIALAKPLDASQPPPAENTLTLKLYPSTSASLLDLRLLDPQGLPLPAGTRASFEADQALGEIALADGWVRLQGRPGLTQLRVTAGKLHGVLPLEFPYAGVSRTEARLEEAP
jgi:hypothetical protein